MKLFILLLVIAIAVFILIKKASKPRYLKIAEMTTLPPELGVNENLHLEKRVQKLDASLPSEFKERLKRRYLSEHPKATEAYYEACFYELKRFFIMCSLLNNVPMFSNKVDAIWHKMLMYTKEYEKFSSDLCGEHIHHAPNDSIIPDPHGRAWFDLLYAKLFFFTEFTPVAWGIFFQNPLHPGLLEELRTLSVEDLSRRYFRENADQNTVHALLTEIKSELERFTKENDPYKGLKLTPNAIDSAPILAGAMLYYSYHHLDEYESHMGKLNPANNYSGDSTACGSSCRNDNHDSSCSGDGSGSSCGSSCGGGCGSS